MEDDLKKNQKMEDDLKTKLKNEDNIKKKSVLDSSQI
jgi:hypothetical protein